MSEILFNSMDDSLLDTFQWEPEFVADASQVLNSSSTNWQDFDSSESASFLDSFPLSLFNTLLDYPADPTSQPGPEFQASTYDLAVTVSDQLEISLLGCVSTGHDTDPFQGSLLAPSQQQDSKSGVPQSEVTALEECLHEFEVGTKLPSAGRRRKRFSPQRRKEVDQLRKVGACITCKLSKSPCQLSVPCSTCVKLCGGMKLGRSLCTRQSLVGAPFSLDLWNRDNDKAWLARHVVPLAASARTVHVALYIPDKNVYSSVDLLHDLDRRRQYEVPRIPRGKPTTLQLKVQAHSLPGEQQQQTLRDHDLPSLQQVEAWALETLRELYPTHPSLGFLRTSFVNFAEEYWTSQKDLPLKDMVGKCVRLTALHAVWHRVLIQDSNGSKCVSSAVHKQLAVIITKGIMDIEIEVLSVLQKKILGNKGPGKGHMLPVWTCLWLLILTYRDTIDLWQSPTNENQDRSQVAHQLYDLLVSLYSGLFRPSSPLRLNWLFDDIYELFGRDQAVMQRMGTLKTEFTQFHKFRGHHHSKDALLRKLIFEREMRGMKPPQDPLSQGYYASSKVYYPLRVSASVYPDPTVISTQVNFMQSS